MTQRCVLILVFLGGLLLMAAGATIGCLQPTPLFIGAAAALSIGGLCLWSAVGGWLLDDAAKWVQSLPKR